VLLTLVCSSNFFIYYFKHGNFCRRSKSSSKSEFIMTTVGGAGGGLGGGGGGLGHGGAGGGHAYSAVGVGGAGGNGHMMLSTAANNFELSDTSTSRVNSFQSLHR
jgi:hypothetical protein